MQVFHDDCTVCPHLSSDLPLHLMLLQGTEGGPPSIEAYKRAVYKQPPRHFAVEVLLPQKHGTPCLGLVNETEGVLIPRFRQRI